MACSVLDKARLVTEAIATVRAHAVEVRLVFTVTTMWVFAVLIEPAQQMHRLRIDKQIHSWDLKQIISSNFMNINTRDLT
jgi:hypothetical protein